MELATNLRLTCDKEYIEREAFVNVIDREIAQCHSEFISSELKYLKAIIPMYAADVVERKRGKWEGTADGYADGELVYDMWECSECGFDADGADEKPEWNFCPNCGADMRGENNA